MSRSNATIARTTASACCTAFGVIHIYWLLGGGIGLPDEMRLTDDPPLTIAAILALPLSFGFAWLPWSRIGSSPKTTLLAAAAAFAFVHSLPPLAGLGLATFQAGQLPDLTERDRLALFLYEPVWLAGGVVLAWAAAEASLGRRTG